MRLRYDVIVVGGGHAGSEAAAAAARLGAKTVLITPDLTRIAQMSCNPAIGGVAKGTVAREVGALGGVMAQATDASRIHFRMLNRSKGPAVWGPRAQCDRALYPIAVRRILDGLENLDLFQEMVTGLHVDEGVRGVETRGGIIFEGAAVVVTAGTFLRGRIHVGGSAAQGRGGRGRGPRSTWPKRWRRAGSRWRGSRRGRHPGSMDVRWTSPAASARTETGSRSGFRSIRGSPCRGNYRAGLPGPGRA